MSEGPKVIEGGETRVNSSAGHLSLHVMGAHPAEIDFSFDRETKRLSASFVASAVIQATLIVLLLIASRYHSAVTASAILPEEPNKNIIWLSQPGPGGGGGGGGNKMKEPPRKAELPGKDKLTVPVEQKPQLEQQAKVEPNPIEQLNIPAKDLASALDSIPGAIEGPPTFSQGSG